MAKKKEEEVVKNGLVEEETEEEEVIPEGKEITIAYRSFKGKPGERTFTDKKAAMEFKEKFNGTIV